MQTKGIASQDVLSAAGLDAVFVISQARVPKLRAALTEVSARLGTLNEREGDLVLAQQLAHELRNTLCVATIASALQEPAKDC